LERRDRDNLGSLLANGGWALLVERLVAEAARAMNELLEVEDPIPSAKLKAKIQVIDWTRNLPKRLIEEYDADEARSREDNPLDGDNPRERLSPLPGGEE